MCGRFALYTPPARIARYFGATLAEGADGEHAPSWNVAPTDSVLGVRAAAPGRRRSGRRKRAASRTDPHVLPLGPHPLVVQGRQVGQPALQRRASETVATRASFREAFRERRIIVPADGFYEWHKTKTGGKQPHYFSRADGRADGVRRAGGALARQGGAERRAADPELHVITAPGGADMQGIHDRMPVILDPATFDLWLDPTNEDVEELKALLRPPPAGTVMHHQVGQRVGNVKNNDPELIATLKE